MKSQILIIAVFFIAFQVNAQVGVGTNTPNASAQLDVTSTTKGMLVPRMTDIQRGNISSPAEGLLVYQTSAPAGFYVYKSGAWVSILDNSTSYLPLTGGALTGALTGTTAVFNSTRTPILIGGTGTSSTITYKPTSGNGGANADHIFQVGNNGATEAMRIKGNGNVGIGASPDASAKLDVSSSTQGMLVPRMTALQRGAISSPADGLLVYQTDGATGFYVHKGSNVWKALVESELATTKVSGHLERGVALTLDNISVRVTPSGNKNAQIKFNESGTFQVVGTALNRFGDYPNYNTGGPGSVDVWIRAVPSSSTVWQGGIDDTYYKSWQATNFTLPGGSQEILFFNQTQDRSYRITVIYGHDTKNVIHIERLY